jgi:hypothetical protein
LSFLTTRATYSNPPSSALTAEDASGADITETIGTITFVGNAFEPQGFRGTDLTITWRQAGADSLTVDAYDMGNRVAVPFMEQDDPKGQNWSFESPSGAWAGQYLVGAPTLFRTYVSGTAILSVGATRLPQEGDVWTVRQRSYSVSAEGDTVPESRPIVQGSIYRVDLTGGGQDAGEIDLSKIRVVPNPYLATSRFEFGPDNRQIQFTNLPSECAIRIYTISGNLVRILDHTPDEGGTETYDLRTRYDLELASGNYYYHVTTPDGRTHLGRFAVIQ